MPYCTSWLRSVPVIPPGNCCWMTATGYSTRRADWMALGSASGRSARRPRRSASRRCATSWPSRRRLSTVTSVEGIERPLASERDAGVDDPDPRLDPDEVVEGGHRRCVLWKCISSGIPPAAARSRVSEIQRRARRASTPASSPSTIVTPAPAGEQREHVGVVVVGVDRGLEKMTCGEGAAAGFAAIFATMRSICAMLCRQSKIQRLSMPCLASERIQSSTIESGVEAHADDAVGAGARAQGRVGSAARIASRPSHGFSWRWRTMHLEDASCR